MDINAIKAKIKGIESGKPKRAKWKPTGTHSARLLPIPGDEDLALIIKWHYGVDQGRPMYCPSTHGDACPFCDLAKHLKAWKDEKGRDKPEAKRKMDWEWGKKIDAAIKHYTPVALRKEGSLDLEGPFLWEMTPKTYTALLKICANDDWNEDHPEGGGLKVLTSLEHGLDVVITFKKKGENGNTTSYDMTEVEERKKFSALVKGDKAAGLSFLARVPDITEVAKPISTKEAEVIFAAYKASVNDDSDGNADVEYSAPSASNNAEKAAVGGSSVDDVVSKLQGLINKS